MVRIIKKKTQDPEKMHRMFQKGYGTEHPEKIHGYRGLFFSLGNVYVSDSVYRAMQFNPEYKELVMESLKRFSGDDYGYVSSWVEDCNIEARWLFGGDLIGQYAGGKRKTMFKTEIPSFYIKIRTYENDTYVTDIDDWDWVIREEEKRDVEE